MRTIVRPAGGGAGLLDAPRELNLSLRADEYLGREEQYTMSPREIHARSCSKSHATIESTRLPTQGCEDPTWDVERMDAGRRDAVDVSSRIREVGAGHATADAYSPRQRPLVRREHIARVFTSTGLAMMQ